MTPTFRSMAVCAALALASVSAVQANPVNAMMEQLDKLHQLHVKGYAGAKPAEVKALRQDFRAAVQMAKGQARAEYGRFSAGKTPEQVDKALRAITEKAGASPDVMRTIDSLGGPYKVMQQADRLIDDFSDDVLSGSQKYAVMSPAQHQLLALLGVGDAQAGRFKRGACVAVMWVATVGSSPDSAYRLCDRYS